MRFMPATISMGRITIDGITRDVADIISMTGLRSGVLVAFSDGSSAVADIRPGELFELSDACPWASCRV